MSEQSATLKAAIIAVHRKMIGSTCCTDICPSPPCACAQDFAEAALAASPAPREEADRLGSWMLAALDDPSVCTAMKDDISAWFAAGQPVPAPPQPEGWQAEHRKALLAFAMKSVHYDGRADGKWHFGWNVYATDVYEIMKPFVSGYYFERNELIAALTAAPSPAPQEGGDVIERLRAVILNIQALAETGQPIDAAKLATRCRHALIGDSSRLSEPK